MGTLLTYWQALARALDDLDGPYAVASAASNQVASARLVNNTPSASLHRYDNAWVHVDTGAGAGQLAHMVANGYVPSTGALTLTPNWTTIPSPADQFSLTYLFPARGGAVGADTDYRSLVNRALALILAPDRLSIAITTADTYSTTAYPWLDRPDRLVRVLEPAPMSGRAPTDASWRGPRLVVDGASPFLQLNAPFTTASGNLVLEVWRPGDSLVNGVESTTGLSAGTDTALPRVEDVVMVALLEGYQVLANRNPSRPSGQWVGKWGMQLKLIQSEHARRMALGDRTLELAAASAMRQAPASGQEAA